jgi:hypothetical protein
MADDPTPGVPASDSSDIDNTRSDDAAGSASGRTTAPGSDAGSADPESPEDGADAGGADVGGAGVDSNAEQTDDELPQDIVGAESDGSVSEDEHVDELPEDLDAAGFVGPYLFPNNNRRRIPGYLYLASAVACVAVWLLVDDSPYVNGGLLLAAGLLTVVGVYSIVAGWNLDVDEQDALVAASRAVGFPIGHASAQMGWRGLLSRPTWRILLYSSENPPAKRGLVLVDGVDGEIVQHFVEDNPEDWSELDTGDDRS